MFEQETLLGSISLTTKRLRRLGDRHGSRLGLTGTQGRILCYVFIASQYRDLYQRDIEEEFDIRRSSASGILKLLEKNGMITREPVPEDGRLKKIVLTEKAIKLQQEVLSGMNELERKLHTGLTPGEVKTFVMLSNKIRNNIELPS